MSAAGGPYHRHRAPTPLALCRKRPQPHRLGQQGGGTGRSSSPSNPALLIITFIGISPGSCQRPRRSGLGPARPHLPGALFWVCSALGCHARVWCGCGAALRHDCRQGVRLAQPSCVRSAAAMALAGPCVGSTFWNTVHPLELHIIFHNEASTPKIWLMRGPSHLGVAETLSASGCEVVD